MVENFFSSFGSQGIGANDINNNDDDADDNLQGDSTGLSIIASGPVFIKSAQTTLLTEEHDIRQKRQMKAKVTFAKPKPKAQEEQKKPQNASSSKDNFVKIGSKTDR